MTSATLPTVPSWPLNVPPTASTARVSDIHDQDGKVHVAVDHAQCFMKCKPIVAQFFAWEATPALVKSPVSMITSPKTVRFCVRPSRGLHRSSGATSVKRAEIFVWCRLMLCTTIKA